MQTRGKTLNQETVIMVLAHSPSSMVEEKYKELSTLFLTYTYWNDGTSEVDYSYSRVIFSSFLSGVHMLQHVLALAFSEIVGNSDTRMSSYYGAKFEDLAFAHLSRGREFKTRLLHGTKNIRRISLPKAETRFLASHADMNSTVKVLRNQKDEHRVENVVWCAPK